MTEKWVIEVLADLRKFAKDKRMVKLVEHLDDTIHIAAFEMAAQNREANVPDQNFDEVEDYKQPAYVV
jgi:uncharacterized protein YihD (DUF1040 family)